MRVVLNMLRSVIFILRAQLSLLSQAYRWLSWYDCPACPMSAWTHDVHLVCRPWRLLAGHLLLRCSMEGRRQVISGPMRQVEEIFRSTALLNPALAPSHPHIVVLLSATRVCLAGQARPRPSARSRSGGAGDLRDLRERGYRRSPAHPMLAWHTCSAAAPVWAVHGRSAASLPTPDQPERPRSPDSARCGSAP